MDAFAQEVCVEHEGTVCDRSLENINMYGAIREQPVGTVDCLDILIGQVSLGDLCIKQLHLKLIHFHC